MTEKKWVRTYYGESSSDKIEKKKGKVSRQTQSLSSGTVALALAAPMAVAGSAALCQSLGLVYIRTDCAGVVQEWSSAATAATGVGAAAAVGRNAGELLRPPGVITAAIADAAAGKVAGGIEVWPGDPAKTDSAQLLLQVTMAEAGDGGGVLLVGQNLSQKNSGQNHSSNLAQAVKDNQTKTQFLATMSHEMRTPLNVIMGMNDLILETSLDQEQRVFSEQIKVSADRLLVLVRDLIFLTEIESGSLQPNLADFDLRRVFEDAIDTVAIAGNSKGLEICGFLDPSAPTLMHGDGDRLRQILDNLLANGVRLTESGGVFATMSLVSETATHCTFKCDVRFTGQEISAEVLKDLLDLQRGSATRQGTPSADLFQSKIGFLMSQQICRLLQGELSCETKVGEGSTSSFTAVFAKAATVPPPAVASVGPWLPPFFLASRVHTHTHTRIH